MVKDHSREETHCNHYMGYSFQLAARDLLYAPSHIQDSTHCSLYYTSCGAMAGTRLSSMGLPWGIDPTTYNALERFVLIIGYISASLQFGIIMDQNIVGNLRFQLRCFDCLIKYCGSLLPPPPPSEVTDLQPQLWIFLTQVNVLQHLCYDPPPPPPPPPHTHVSVLQPLMIIFLTQVNVLQPLCYGCFLPRLMLYNLPVMVVSYPG